MNESIANTSFTPARLAAAIIGSLAFTPVISFATELDSGTWSFKGSFYYGAVARSEDRNPALLTTNNGAVVGVAGTAVGGNNGDDGNLNYYKGDVVSRALKGSLELRYQDGGYGFVGGIKGWSDFAMRDSAVPWGNGPNGYTPGKPLSDNGFEQRSRFSGVVLDDFYVFGKSSLGDNELTWKLGQQRLTWGSVFQNYGGLFAVGGGLGSLTPRDAPGSLRAGATAEDGTIPVPAAVGNLKVGPTTSIEAFVQLAFVPTALPGCGTFFSAADYLASGCDKVLVGAATIDPRLIGGGLFIKRAADVKPTSGGGAGLGLRQKLESIDAELGLFVGQYASRTPYTGGVTSGRVATPSAPFVPGNPGGLNPQYFIEYPDNIQIFGVTLGKKLIVEGRQVGGLQAELSYKPNQPFQYNSLDGLNALLSPVAPSQLRAAVATTPPGSVFTSYERHKEVQLNVGAMTGLPGVLGAQSVTVGGEFSYKNVPDLPDAAVTRFRRSDLFGIGPVNGICTGGVNQCTLDGYVTRDAYALRMRFGMNYPQLFSGVDFTPMLSYGWDLKGWSEDGAINEGRRLAILSLKAVIQKAYSVELAWQPTWGGIYNPLNDRSTVAFNLGYQF